MEKNSHLYNCLFKINEKKPSIVDLFFLLYRNRIEPWPPNRGMYQTVTSVYILFFYIAPNLHLSPCPWGTLCTSLVRSYLFSNVRKFRTQCAMTFSVSKLPFCVSLVEESWVDIQRVSLVLRWNMRLDGMLGQPLKSSLQQGRPRYSAWLLKVVFSSHWSMYRREIYKLNRVIIIR